MYYPSTSQASLKKALWLLSVLACAVYLVMKIPFYTEFRSIEPILVVPLIYFFVVSQLERKSFPDRKSTRLNSSHVRISYAVFCLKKKKKNKIIKNKYIKKN